MWQFQRCSLFQTGGQLGTGDGDTPGARLASTTGDAGGLPDGNGQGDEATDGTGVGIGVGAGVGARVGAGVGATVGATVTTGV